MTAETKPRKSLMRRLWRAGIVGVLLVAVAVAAGPSLLSNPALSDWVLKRLFADVHGTVSAERLDFGWFSPPRISGLVIRSIDGQPVVSFGSIEAEQPLWQLVSHPAEIGHVTVDAPHAYLVVTSQGTNFAATFPHDPNRRVPARWRQEAMHVAVEHGAFTWQLAGSSHKWSLGGLQLGVQLLPAWLTETHAAQFVVEPATVVNHAELSTGMCEDVLKFIAPVLSSATTTNGNFSLALGGGTIPFDHPRDAQLQGVLTLHQVNIGPGEWLDKLAKFIKLPSEVSIARESAVTFTLANQRVQHSGLEFGTGELHVRTSGSVGFDESLDLLAEVQLDLSDSTVAERPVLRALNHRVLRLPIKGTFKHPEFDWGGRDDASQGLLAAFQGTLTPETAAQLPNQLQASGLLAAPSGDTSAAADLGIAAGELLKQFAERRRERKQERAAAEQQAEQPPPPGANPGTVSDNNPSDGPSPGTNAPPTGATAPLPGTAAPPKKRGALGQVLRAIVDAAAEVATQPNPAPDAASAPQSPPAPPAPMPPAAPPATTPPAAAPAGPSLSQPTNPMQPPIASAPPANPPAVRAPNTGATANSAPGTPTPPLPAAVPPVTGAAVPPPPLLSTPLPAAPFQPPTTNPSAKAPPAEDAPRRPLGRALRALVEAAGEAAAQSAGPQAIGPAASAVVPPGQPAAPAGPGAPAAGAQNPPLAQTPPPPGAPAAADAHERRPVLRRLFRAAIEAAAEAAAQPPAAPQTPPAAPPMGESLPVPAPAPAPAPE